MVFVKSRRPLRNFQQEVQKKGYESRIDQGTRTVSIEHIVGSISRSADFSRGFSPKSSNTEARVRHIEEVFGEHQPFPTVDLYKLDDEYYVVDGHHRIAAARRRGQRFVDAHVIEYIPPATSRENRSIRRRSEFALETGIDDITLSHPDGYDTLMEQVARYRAWLNRHEPVSVGLREAARRWYGVWYLPVAERIEATEAHQSFPRATVGDIYVYLCRQLEQRTGDGQGDGEDVGSCFRELDILIQATKNITEDARVTERLLDIFSPLIQELADRGTRLRRFSGALPRNASR